MTLILNAVAPRWAMQASDRRLSVVDDRGRPTGLDPVDRNKAIFVAERITFAYTGHADIGGTDTAEWLQTRLGGCFSRGLDPAAAIEEIRIMATQYFASIDADPRDGAHTFAGVGWTEGRFRDRTPFITWLSNSLDEEGNPLPSPAGEFRSGRRLLRDGEPFGPSLRQRSRRACRHRSTRRFAAHG
jgi:hypothetical protein